MNSYIFTPGGVYKFVDPGQQKSSCAGYFENYADMIIKCAKAGSGISDHAEEIKIISPEKQQSIDIKSSTDLKGHQSRSRIKHQRKTSKLLIKTRTASKEESDSEKALKTESSDYTTAYPKNYVNLEKCTSEEVNRSCTSMENVCHEVRQKTYESRKSKSDPLQPTQVDSATDTTETLRNALKVGLVQTQSENQIRLAVSTSVTCTKEFEEYPPVTPVPSKHKPEHWNQYNIPPYAQIDELQLDTQQTRSCLPVNLDIYKNQIAALEDHLQRTDLPLQTKRKLEKVARKLGLNELPRIKAQQNLHQKLIREFDVTDSLLEFHRQMQMVDKQTNKGCACEGRPKQEVLRVVADELFVPDRKINRIVRAVNSGNNSPRQHSNAKQDLGDKKKVARKIKKQKKTSTRSAKSLRSDTRSDINQRYPNSLLFNTALSDRKETSASVIVYDPDTMRCDCSKCRIVVKNNAPTPPPQSAKSGSQWLQTKSAQAHRKSGLGCLDILDELTSRDVSPFRSAYPRRDHICTDNNASHKHVKDMYLYRLMYGDQQNLFSELVKKDSRRLPVRRSSRDLPIASKHSCVRRYREPSEDHIKSRTLLERSRSRGSPKRPNSIHFFRSERKTSTTSSQNQLLNSKIQVHKSRATKLKQKKSPTNTNKVMTSYAKPLPQFRTTVMVMPVKVMRFDSKEGKEEVSKLLEPYIYDGERTPGSDLGKIKEEVADTLRPYIYDPQLMHSSDTTVLPATLTYYTNPRIFRNKPSAIPKPQRTQIPQASIKEPITNKRTPALMSFINQLKKDNANKSTRHTGEDTKEPFNTKPSKLRPVEMRQTKAHKTIAQNVKKQIERNEAEKLLTDIRLLSNKLKTGDTMKKAIDSIEAKIAKILSEPNETNPNLKFSEVETEIQGVIKMLHTRDTLTPIQETDLESKPTNDLDPKTKVYESKPATDLVVASKPATKRLKKSVKHSKIQRKVENQSVDVLFTSNEFQDSEVSKRNEAFVSSEPINKQHVSKSSDGIFKVTAVYSPSEFLEISEDQVDDTFTKLEETIKNIKDECSSSTIDQVDDIVSLELENQVDKEELERDLKTAKTEKSTETDHFKLVSVETETSAAEEKIVATIESQTPVHQYTERGTMPELPIPKTGTPDKRTTPMTESSSSSTLNNSQIPVRKSSSPKRPRTPVHTLTEQTCSVLLPKEPQSESPVKSKDESTMSRSKTEEIGGKQVKAFGSLTDPITTVEAGAGLSPSDPMWSPNPTTTYIARTFTVHSPKPQSPKIEEETNTTPDEDKSSKSLSVRTKSGKISIVNKQSIATQARTFQIASVAATAYVIHETKEYHTVKLHQVAELESKGEEKEGKILRKYGVMVRRSIHNNKSMVEKEEEVVQTFDNEEEANGNCKREYGLLLNSVYGTLSIMIFLGLIQSYSCQ